MWGLGVLIPLLGAGALRVIQEPGELQVTAGDTATLVCRVEVARNASEVQLRMEWLAWHPPRATLSLPQLWDNDSGRYICQVILEIPRHATAAGNGTELRVTPAAAPGGHQTALLWGLLGGLGGAVLLLGMALLGHRCCHRSPDTPIYLNVVSSSARNPKKPPPPEPQHNLYQRERGPPLPPRP